MAKYIKTIFKTETLSLSECKDGFWLYDYVVGMNISMRVKTEQDAYIEALMYYQKTLKKIKIDYKNLNTKVETFVSQFYKEDEDFIK